MMTQVNVPELIIHAQETRDTLFEIGSQNAIADARYISFLLNYAKETGTVEVSQLQGAVMDGRDTIEHS